MARLIRQGGARVVQCEGVIAIVDVGVRQSQEGLPDEICTRRGDQLQFAAQTGFVSLINIVAVEKAVGIVAIALMGLCSQAKTAECSDGPCGRQAQGAMAVVADIGFQASGVFRFRVSGCNVD